MHEMGCLGRFLIHHHLSAFFLCFPPTYISSREEGSPLFCTSLRPQVDSYSQHTRDSNIEWQDQMSCLKGPVTESW